jgi:FkbM family methyltransferase
MTFVIIDVGCHPHGHEVSVEPLIDRYAPAYLAGYDPYSGLVEGETQIGLTRVELTRAAVWNRDGTISYTELEGERSWDSTVVTDKTMHREWEVGHIEQVACVDASRIVRELARAWPHQQIVLKIDAEGAEFTILDRLLETGDARLIDRALVEWHDHRLPGGYAVARQRLTRRWPTRLERWVQ